MASESPAISCIQIFSPFIANRQVPLNAPNVGLAHWNAAPLGNSHSTRVDNPSATIVVVNERYKMQRKAYVFTSTETHPAPSAFFNHLPPANGVHSGTQQYVVLFLFRTVVCQFCLPCHHIFANAANCSSLQTWNRHVCCNITSVKSEVRTGL